jgi:hypothetical protein
MPDLGKHVVGTHEFDLDGVWLSPSPVAIALLSDCFEEGLGTGVINDGAIGRFMRPNVAFANRFFDETLRIPPRCWSKKPLSWRSSKLSNGTCSSVGTILQVFAARGRDAAGVGFR